MGQSMYKILLISIVSILVSSPLFSAQRMYVLLAIDTHSTTKRSSSMDRDRMTRAVHGIASACNMKLKLSHLNGKALTPKAVNRWLHRIKPSKNDVVLFYFSGHGNRDPSKKSPWPYMYLSAKNKHMPLKTVTKKIRQKKARLSLILADCCNSTRSGPAIYARQSSTLTPQETYIRQVQSIQRLFTQSKGVIISSGSSAGKESWDTINGGIFTNAWLHSLQNELRRSNPSWSHVFKKTKKLCSPLQKPQAKISIRH